MSSPSPSLLSLMVAVASVKCRECMCCVCCVCSVCYHSSTRYYLVQYVHSQCVFIVFLHSYSNLVLPVVLKYWIRNEFGVRIRTTNRYKYV